MKNPNKRYQLFFHVIVMLLAMQQANAQTSSLVSVGADGKLLYTADSKGNVVPEFSGVGYMNSEADIPAVGVVKTLYPVAGDNLTNVQNAINEVALMPLGANGFRGAILFKSGTYNVSDTIQIKVSGIVLRGEGYDGSGTNFIATKTSQHSLFNFAGTTGTSNVSATKKAITDAYVPIGAKQVTVASGHTFVTGDRVFVHRIPNAAWISLLGMNLLSQIDPLATDWTAAAYDMNYERKVTGVNGNVISLDAPIMDIIDPLYSTGEIIKYTSARIAKCGIENMRISSVYASATDENHGWEAVTFSNLTDGWAKNLEVYYFGYSAVHILSSAAWITVDGCKMFDAKSLIVGGRRFSFNVDGQRCLVKNCVTRDGRHDYVNGSRTCGPTVFYNCTATLQNNDIGPHHRWSTGILFDNIIGDGRMDVQNRSVAGGGHGWAGAQVMFWNCDALRMVIQDPPGDARNWAIGCNAPEITNVGDMVTEPLGIVESQGTHIAAIPSLFMAQLNERLTAIRQNQTINFSALPAKTYGNADFSGGASSLNATQPIVYTSNNIAVATIVSGNIHIVAAGTADITASQAGDGTYPAASVTKTLTVNKASLSIKVNDTTKTQGQANPLFTFTYTGFVLGDTAATLTTLPAVATSATINSAPGNYIIAPEGAVALNYNITYIGGSLTIFPSGGNGQQSFNAYLSNSTTLTVSVFSVQAALGDIIIYDVLGRPLMKKNLFIPAGFISTTMHMPSIPSGIYIVVIKGSGVDLGKRVYILK